MLATMCYPDATHLIRAIHTQTTNTAIAEYPVTIQAMNTALPRLLKSEYVISNILLPLCDDP